MLDSLIDLISDAWWTYPLIFAVALLDAFLPIVPSETMVVTAGVLAGSGKLAVELVIVLAALGAICGDNVSFWLGRTVGPRVRRRFFHGKREQHLERAETMLAERGGYLIVIARFIPGGRTATTFAAGLLHMPVRKFLGWDIVAGFIWGTYATLIGYFGGKAFEDDPSKGLLLALGVALGVALLVEGTRYVRKRRKAQRREREQAPIGDAAVDDALDRS